MKNIVIVGAGGVGRETSLIIQQINELKSTWNLIGFIDDDVNSWGNVINGYPVIGGMDSLEKLSLDTYVVVAIANYKVKKLEASSITKALVTQELKRYFATPIYVMNTAIGMVLLVAASIATLFVSKETLAEILKFQLITRILK